MSWLSDIVDVVTEPFGFGSSDILGGLGSLFGSNTVGGSLLKTAGTLGLGYLANEAGITGPQITRTGYQGGIPRRDMIRSQVPGAIRPPAPPLGADMAPAPSGAPPLQYTYDPNRRPGSSGRRYFTDQQYVPQGNAEALAAAQAADVAQREPLARYNLQNPARQLRPAVVRPPMAVQTAANGGIMGLRRGRYLAGNTDGMADEVPANINGTQEAALSDGEFVIPADVVSHLGNGNSNAGARRLDEMMARIREQRTGRRKQAPQVNPKSVMPV